MRFPLAYGVEKIYRREKNLLITKDAQSIGEGILIKENYGLAVRFPLANHDFGKASGEIPLDYVGIKYIAVRPVLHSFSETGFPLDYFLVFL
ncbi:MAG: hypothetical protein PHY86_03575 [Candidatus Gracilibacteria bacterium]|nr:hypothetical protein [Candidatus Gracilibacteria bacterium]